MVTNTLVGYIVIPVRESVQPTVEKQPKTNL